MIFSKYIKIISYNLIILLITVLFIELIFGGWLKKNNLGAYFREHRMKKVSYEMKYQEKKYNFLYLRNYHGFIGNEIDPINIKYVFIGGSTADERWKPRELSIVGQLNKKFKKDLIDIKITNAGIEGQTSIGYIANFKFWFSKLENFKPKYFIFYTGINDLIREDYNTFDYSDGLAKLVAKDKKEYFFDYIKTKSIFYDLTRKIKHKYHTKKQKIYLDLDKSIKKYPKNNFSKSVFKDSKYNFLKFKENYKTLNVENLLNEETKFVNFYLKNIDKLVSYSNSYGAKAILINQTTAYGAHIKRHLILNYALNKHCEKQKYLCIDLAGDFDGKLDYWFDGVHTTPKGSKIIADTIYPELKDLILKNEKTHK